MISSSVNLGFGDLRASMILVMAALGGFGVFRKALSCGFPKFRSAGGSLVESGCMGWI